MNLQASGNGWLDTPFLRVRALDLFRPGAGIHRATSLHFQVALEGLTACFLTGSGRKRPASSLTGLPGLCVQKFGSGFLPVILHNISLYCFRDVSW